MQLKLNFTSKLIALLLVFATFGVINTDVIAEQKNDLDEDKFVGDSFADKLNLYFPDSTQNSIMDSLINADTTAITNEDSIRIWEMSQDSTARLQQFRHSRSNLPIINIYKKKQSSFFATPKITRTVKIDSSGQYVIIVEKVNGVEIKPNQRLTLEQYIAYKNKAVNKTLWQKEAYSYTPTKGRDELADLFADLTNIVIPLPSSDVFSIFGKNQINIRINGAVDIYGAWKSETTEGLTASALGNTKSAPDFKQTVQINVDGSIGDKLKIGADWNTERTFEYENQLKIKYTGYDDEIIQSVEAGNVSLQTTPLIGGSEALFGVKAKFKFGPFSLTALASQKKGKVEELSITGGSTSKEFTKRLYDYSENHYFVDGYYYDNAEQLFTAYYQSTEIPTLSDELRGKEITSIEVWKQEPNNGVNSDQIINAKAFIDLPAAKDADFATDASFYNNLRDTGEPKPGRIIVNTFKKLVEGSDYVVDYKTGFITFKTSIERDKAIAIAYRTKGLDLTDNADDEIYGEFENKVNGKLPQNSYRVLKLVKINGELLPEYEDAWKLQLRNIYPIGGRGIKKEGFVFDIKYEKSGGDPVNALDGFNLLETFGLDKTNDGGSGGPDGLFDFGSNTINPVTGEVIFPVMKPFSKEYLVSKGFSQARAEELSFDEIYSSTKTVARRVNQKDKFILTGESAAASSSSYNIGFNVVENSVRVILNGAELTPGVDYVVDYMMGQITIRNDAALTPGADLKITYEQNDLFSVASKTLFGFRGIYDFNKDTKLGFSYLSLNQKSLSDKVRIGEEPLSNTIYGADFSTKIELPFLTKGLNYIWSTGGKSEFTFSGELAYINPDPNTKKSKIRGDEGLSIAYIDDFEGSKKTIPISIASAIWKDISVPIEDATNKEQEFKHKAMANWYTQVPATVKSVDIWGDRRSVGKSDGQISVLDFVYEPTIRGRYNGDYELNNTALNWGGMMTSLSTSASNLDEENIEYIEFWMLVKELDDSDKDQKLIVDLGEISEDIIPNNVRDNEDKNLNDAVDQGEDVGLDGMTDAEEKLKFPNSEYPDDPSGDNYSASRGNYARINGTEGNAQSADVGRVPDDEDLNNNGYLDNVNSYFRYEIPLHGKDNSFIAGEGVNGDWLKIRIPLREPTKNIGNPSLAVAKSIRFWVKGASQKLRLAFTEINLVGNQWQKVITPDITKEDSTLLIKTVNIEDNPEYEMPPGVEREKDRTDTQNDIYKNEQSLWLEINDLDDGDKREIIKYLYKPLDVFNYKRMKLFVHGDDDDSPGRISNYVDSENYAAEMYFRFGTDTSNYYEYRQPIKRGWEEISIIFDNLTTIKQSVEDITKLYSRPVSGKPGHKIGVKGQPTLTKVKFFLFGIVNPKTKGLELEKVSGDLWLNELRVLEAEDSKGLAYKFGSSLTLADLAKVSFNMAHTDPHFRKLSERFGSRNDSKNWSVAADVDVIKLLPFNMPGSKLSVQYSHTESKMAPLYQPGTDINIDSAKAQYEKQLVDSGMDADSAVVLADKFKKDTETETITDLWTISNVKFVVPSKKWYFRETINKFVFGFSYNRTKQRSPTIELGKKWNWKASFGYNAKFSRNNFFKFADIPVLGHLFTFIDGYKDARFNFTPQDFNLSFNANRFWSYSLTRENPRTTINRDFTSSRSMGFNWKLTERAFLNMEMSYRVDVNSSYAHLLVDNVTNFDRPENEIWRDILNGPLFGKDTKYTQRVEFKLTPRLPSWLGLQKNFRFGFRYSSTYNWSHDLRSQTGGIRAGFDNKFTATLSVNLQDIGKQIFPDFKSSDKKKSSTKSSNRGRTRRGRRGSDNAAEKTETHANVESLAKQEKKTGSATEKKMKVLEDDLMKKENDSEANEEVDNGPSFFESTLVYLQQATKWVFFDYRKINITFDHSEQFIIPGLRTSNAGFSNFWGFSNDVANGPTRGFMLGLSTDGYGLLQPKLNLNKSFAVKNSINLKTSRELWKGARLDISWNVNWGKNDAISMSTDEDGYIIPEKTYLQSSSSNMNKTFLALPFGSNVDNIRNAYFAQDTTLSQGKRIEAAFFDEMGSVPGISSVISKFFPGDIGKDIEKYFPRPNWRFNWSGLEKIGFLSKVFSKLSLSHGFSSKYTASWKAVPGDPEQIQSQTVTTGFKPLVGVNFGLDKLIGGKLSGSIKYNVNTSYDVSFSNARITETGTNDISFSASYTKSGFELPLFGLSLKNDITASLSYTMSSSEKSAYDLRKDEDGKLVAPVPLDGTERITIEPKIKYVMSSKVTASVFYRRTTVAPKGASKIPETITNEMGLEVHIAIK